MAWSSHHPIASVDVRAALVDGRAPKVWLPLVPPKAPGVLVDRVGVCGHLPAAMALGACAQVDCLFAAW